ncbi:putative lovastatin nonaketide synthase [Phaeomoniella chlamydospora]|uniref:Putative lovastatin nonaketide synthase n=1 Tax=Phaeomoniella chlamydospora TaxID=158046 RepID=A0A0G2EKS3_PHACM|nr:putative lovastatin nonaketide synthase [Phaeomoniella chlamydospora]
MEEPIAIVGMGCRLPGDCSSPSKLWDFLIAKRSAQTDVPKNRWDPTNWYHPDPNRRGAIASTGGYFLSQDDSFQNFEPTFFGINPLEAATMDPQQRKLMEVVYETFESAGLGLQQIAGSLTGCFVGAFTTDYKEILSRDIEGYSSYQSSGSDTTIISNRVNYVFDLRGPSMTIDTACSSSLYALHVACQNIQLGDCRGAIVAGTSIMMDIKQQLTATKIGILSTTSTCHTFDEQADGFGRAEGITAIYIKRLSDALADGDPIRGIIRATAINTNGKGAGISHPSISGQEAVIRKAYSKANLDLTTTAFVECHGTGTPIGDPIEVQAVGNVFAEARSWQQPLFLTSLKSNIGHTEGASGIASVIKVVKSLETGIIPATYGIRKLNPAINFHDGALKVAEIAEPWPEHLNYKRASLNSFGYGGANAHVILDSVQSYLNAAGINPLRTWTWLKGLHSSSVADCCSQAVEVDGCSKLSAVKYLLVHSANSQRSLRANIAAVKANVGHARLQDLAHTLTTRSSLHERAFTVSPGIDTLIADPENWSFGQKSHTVPSIALVFTGQGAQWPQMGYSLLTRFPVFFQSLQRLDRAMATVVDPPDWTILEALSSPANVSRISEIAVSVTLCSALQIALVDLLWSWGIHAKAVVGHSSGEAAAAYAAGLLTASEAIITSYYRGLSIKKHARPGAMMAVGLGASEALKYADGREDIYVACHNSPASATLSGSVEAIEEIGSLLREKAIFARVIKTGGNANHSPFVADAARYFRSEFADALPSKDIMSHRKGTVPMYSCITGGKVDSHQVGIYYWGDNIEKPVLFDEAVQSLLKTESHIDLLLEVGPHSALAGPLRQIRAAVGRSPEELPYLPSLARGQDNVSDMLQLAGSLYLTGYPIDLCAVNAMEVNSFNKTSPGKLIVDFPAYQWHYDELPLVEDRVSHDWRCRKHPHHDLLGSREPISSDTAPIWRNILKLSDVPWLVDHKIGDSVLFPAAGYVAMAVEALRQVASDHGFIPESFSIRDMSIMSAIILNADAKTEIVLNLVHLDQAQSGPNVKQYRFEISSLGTTKTWSKHAFGIIRYDVQSRHEELEMQMLQIQRPDSLDWYSRFAKFGLKYGPAFRTLRTICSHPRPGHALAKVSLNATAGTMQRESPYMIHPTALDGCLQLGLVAGTNGGAASDGAAYLPFEIQSMKIWNHGFQASLGPTATVYNRCEASGLRKLVSDLEIVTNRNQPLAKARISLLKVDSGLVDSELALPQPYQRLVWFPDINQIGGALNIHEFLDLGTSPHKHARSQKVQQLGSSVHSEERAIHYMSRSMNGLRKAQLPIDTILSVASLHKLIYLLLLKRPGLNILHFSSRTDPAQTALATAIRPDPSRSAEANYKVLYTAIPGHDADCGSYTNDAVSSQLEIDLALGIFDQGITRLSYDLVVISNLYPDFNTPETQLQQCLEAVQPGGRLVVVNTSTEAQAIVSRLINHTSSLKPVLTIGDHAIVLFENQVEDEIEKDTIVVPKVNGEPIYAWLVYHKEVHPLLHEINKVAGRRHIRQIPFEEVHGLPENARIIMLVELVEPLLSKLQENELPLLQHVLKSARSVVWVTMGSLLSGVNPEKSMMLGMLKVLENEYPHLSLATVDLESTGADLHTSAELIWKVQAKFQESSNGQETDRNIIERCGVPYIGRYLLDRVANTDYSRFERSIPEPSKFDPGLSMELERVGNLGSLFFREKVSRPKDESISQNQVIVHPKAYALSKLAVTTLRGQNFDEHFSCEFLGVISHVQSNKSQFRSGDHVICLKPGRFDSEVLLDEEACFKVEEEQGQSLLGKALPYYLARQALLPHRKLRCTDNVLVAAPGDPLTLAAIDILHRQKIEPMVVYGNEDERDFLSKGSSISPERLIHKAEIDCIRLHKHGSALHGFQAILVGGGLTNLHRLWEHLAPNGKFILCDQPVPADIGALDASKFASGASLCSVSRKSLLEEPEEMKGALVQVSGNVGVNLRWPSTSKFVISELQKAAEEVSKQPFGALDKPAAASFIKELLESSQEISVEVVRGNVTNRADVDQAVGKANFPIRGVIQAAAVFGDSLIESMDIASFNKVMQPKVQGTINLHEATKDLSPPLDFFVMTSSTVGVVGPTTQSHYAAANTFLDFMARRRWSLGLQACSLSLGMVVGVGHVLDHPYIEEAQRKRGSYGIPEAEFLRLIERACTPRDLSGKDTDLDDELDNALIVTGMDPTRILKPSGRIPDWTRDSRLCHIAYAMGGVSELPQDSRGADGAVDPTSNKELLALLRTDGTTQDNLQHAVQEMVLQELSSLVLLPVEKLKRSLGRPLSELGMDSIMGSALRGWARKELKADVPFMEVLEGGRALNGLIEMIWSKVNWNELLN